MIKKGVTLLALSCLSLQSFSWGFFGHKKINYMAVFLLPEQMINFYKTNIDYLSEHAVDPDKRRYIVKAEAPRHYIDLDHYGEPPFLSLPRNWDDAVQACTLDSLNKYGIVPYWIQQMQYRLTTAFKTGNKTSILKLSAELGHYVADAHVPLHANSNHNGQCTDQVGIHGFWESRIPELLADVEWNFIIGKGVVLHQPTNFIWDRIIESAVASDSVLRFERTLNKTFQADKKYAIEPRNGKNSKQYSSAYTIAYNKMLNGMVERRMRESIFAVASFWMTAWVNAGQPNLSTL